MSVSIKELIDQGMDPTTTVTTAETGKADGDIITHSLSDLKANTMMFMVKRLI